MTQRKPKCFIAMAFDHEDTDAIYEHGILPVLKANDIEPVIINRREDNRDINNQIIDLLNSCDFCITDLTYTRPSVYFEAGYAQRTVEVIYTVRADHLHKNQPEDLRVHFDLQMKPIIKWQNERDTNFPKRLEKRLKATVLKEWNKIKRAKAAEKKEQEKFLHMPLNDRLTSIKKLSLKGLNSLGYSSWQPLIERISSTEEYTYRQIMKEIDRYPWVLSASTYRRIMKVASLRVENSLTLRPLRDEFGIRFIKSRFTPHLDGWDMIDDPKRARNTIEHHILCSIKSIPQTRIMSAMPTLHWDSSQDIYHTSIDWQHSGSRRKGKSFKYDNVTISAKRRLILYFISGISSIKSYQHKFDKVIEKIKSNQHVI